MHLARRYTDTNELCVFPLERTVIKTAEAGSMKTAPLLSWLGIRGAVIDNQSANPISGAQTHLPYGSGGSFSGAEETGEQGTYIRAAQHIADHASEGIAVGALLLCAAAK